MYIYAKKHRKLLHSQNTNVIITMLHKKQVILNKEGLLNSNILKSNRVISWVSGLLLSAVGGILLSFAFPSVGKPFLAWVGLVPVFASVFLYPRIQGRVNAVCAGVCYYTILYHWMQRFHSLSIIFIAIVFGILFFALPLILTKSIIGRNKKFGLIIVPSVWIVFEYLKTLGPLSFGFGILGYSQFAFPRIIQIADLFGVYGISFLLVCINYAIFFSCHSIFTEKRTEWRRRLAFSLLPAVIIIGMTLIYGEFQLNKELSSLNLRVQLAQFHHNSRTDWNDNEDLFLDEYEEMTMVSQGFSPDLVIFPENAVKRYISIDPLFPIEGSSRILNRISETAALSNASLLLGVLEAEHVDEEISRYNSVFLFNPEGNLSGRYRKVHLVPFGEDDPFNGIFPGLEKMLTNDTDILRLDSGAGPIVLSVENNSGEEFSFGTLICFEGTRSEFVRKYSQVEGVDFLVNITSDAWTRSPGALEQHAAFCVFRAVENRRTLYRVGNGGLSGVINPKGIIVKKLPYFTRGVLLSGLTIPENKTPGLYVRWGDWFVLVCAFIMLFFVVYRIIIYKKARRAVCFN